MCEYIYVFEFEYAYISRVNLTSPKNTVSRDKWCDRERVRTTDESPIETQNICFVMRTLHEWYTRKKRNQKWDKKRQRICGKKR